MLHYSRYNRIVDLPDGTKGLYNLVSGQKLHLNGFTGLLFNNITATPDSKLAKRFAKQGFLVEGDELEKLRLYHFAALNGVHNLGLTICPTRACNFRCPYCFEEHLTGSMSPEVQEKLVNLVKEFIEGNHPKSFSVAWFGGEPLLCPDIIRDLSAKFIELCEANKVKYDASIISNGYLFTPENVTMLENAKVSNCQITLDGPKEQNDKTRILADGRGSYDVIMKNLKTVRTKMRISVRCNTNTENRASYDELEAIIKALKEETGNNISSYPAYMDSDITADKSKLNRQSLDYDGYLEKERSSTVSSLKELSYRPCFCGVQHASSFVVCEDGTLYKCWDDVTVKEHAVANLLEDKNPWLAQMGSVWGQKYLGMDVMQDEECRECQLLPLCGGGCPHKRLSGKKECWKPLEKKLDELIVKSFTTKEEDTTCQEKTKQ